MLPMDNFSTLKKSLASAYHEIMRMEDHEIVDRFGDDLLPGKHIMSTIMGYSVSMKVVPTKSVGEMIYLMN
ncbi:MAG: hypothetical protein JEZ03_01455 [Bacteroidales bacterium]|nr:hypothetical protein [Bacteroidales bacterium]